MICCSWPCATASMEVLSLVARTALLQGLGRQTGGRFAASAWEVQNRPGRTKTAPANTSFPFFSPLGEPRLQPSFIWESCYFQRQAEIVKWGTGCRKKERKEKLHGPFFSVLLKYVRRHADCFLPPPCSCVTSQLGNPMFTFPFMVQSKDIPGEISEGRDSTWREREEAALSLKPQ